MPLSGNTDFRYICPDCAAAVLEPPETYCVRCGKILPSSDGPIVCGACRNRAPAFDLARTLTRFRGPMRPLVHGLKYHAGEHLVPDLVRLLETLVDRVNATPQPLLPDGLRSGAPSFFAAEPILSQRVLVCPVPLHFLKRFRRGYNQTDLLARPLAERIGAPYAPFLLRRVHYTETQTRLSADERAENLRHAFAVPASARPFLFDRDVLLVDDVLTTGSTFSAAASALKQAGARRVVALALARD